MQAVIRAGFGALNKNVIMFPVRRQCFPRPLPEELPCPGDRWPHPWDGPWPGPWRPRCPYCPGWGWCYFKPRIVSEKPLQ